MLVIRPTTTIYPWFKRIIADANRPAILRLSESWTSHPVPGHVAEAVDLAFNSKNKFACELFLPRTRLQSHHLEYS